MAARITTDLLDGGRSDLTVENKPQNSLTAVVPRWQAHSGAAKQHHFKLPDPAARLVRKGSNFERLLCGLSPPASPICPIVHRYTFGASVHRGKEMVSQAWTA
jgi:hypothetical protein